MSSETGSLERGDSADSWLTQYDLVNPKKAYEDITNSIQNGENVKLAARVSAGIGEISVRDATTQVEVEVLFNGLDRVEADGLFGDDSPQIEARGVTNHSDPLGSNGGNKQDLTVVIKLSGDNKISSGHFFLATKEYP
ncbi:MAG: hypothetical protein HXL03_01365 [Candidatus Nanosynbacter sp.]|nr:hypothetical protein [Candidatus Nanogingivalaceae bacterium]MBF1030770.1 hypothetical protein [Candidatus Nanosynbacter sp.]